MATTAAGTGSQVIGKVFIIYGKVQAVAPDGTVRVLGPNSPVYANERIVTEGDGSVSLMLDGPPPVQIDLGRMSDVLLNEDVYGAATPAVVADASADAEKIQQALAEGDQPIELEATAAGGAGDSGGAHPIVNFDLDGNEITPDSGAGTTGVTFGAVDTTPGVLDEAVAPAEEDGIPAIISTSDKLVDETGGLKEVTGLLEFDFGTDGPGAIALSADDATWTAGTKTLLADDGTWQVVVNDDGTYTFTQLAAIDHPDSEDPNDFVEITFTATVTDADGDSVSEDITVAVYDDGPRAAIALEDASVSVDETADDDDGESPVSLGTMTAKLVAVSDSDYGADGAGSTVLSLAIEDGDGADSGLAATDGTPVFLFVNDEGVVEGRVGAAGNDGFIADPEGEIAFTVSIAQDGNVTVTQYLSLEHPDYPDSYDEAVDLTGKISAVVTVTDGDKDVATESVEIGAMISFEDDGPSIDPQYAILANEAENSLIADLGIHFGADGPASIEAIQLTPLDNYGNPLEAGDWVVNKAGQIMTLDGQNLVWQQNGDGSWSAVLVEGSQDYGPSLQVAYPGLEVTESPVKVAFTVTPEQADGIFTGNYTVEIVNEPDGIFKTFDTSFTVAEDGPAQTASPGQFTVDGITIVAQGYDPVWISVEGHGSNETGYWDGYQEAGVKWDDNGIGVLNNAFINAHDEGDKNSPSEQLHLSFYDGDMPATLTSATFSLGHLESKETATWHALDDEGSVVGAGLIPGEGQGAEASQVLTINIQGGFHTVIFGMVSIQSEGVSDGYWIESMTGTAELDADHTVSFEVLATDGDGDTATSTFDVTFDGAGDIIGTEANEVIVGSSGDDVIDGGGGEDLISGGTGADTFTQADFDADKVVDFNATEGDELANLIPPEPV